MIRALAGQTIGRHMTSAAGGEFTGAVTVYVTGDNGLQVVGAVAGGACTHKGRGYHSYVVAAADCDFRQIGYSFEGVGAITQGLDYETITDRQAVALELASATNAYSVRDLIIDALQEIGVIGPADPLDPEIFDLAFRRVRGMYNTFQAMRLLLYTASRTVYTLTPGQQVYTIGDGGDFDGDWPLWISGSEVLPVGDEICLSLVPYHTRQEWYDEPLKTLTDLWPRRFLYEPSYPLGTLTFFPTPTTAAQVAISTPTPLTNPASLDTTLTFSPGYQEAWLYNLAQRLWRPFPKSKTLDYAALRQDAKDSLSLAKRLNDVAAPYARVDAALTGRGGYDIRSNQTR